MRRFVIIGHKATTDAGFKLNDMAGGAGRLDVLLRCINSAFFLSHGIRRDVEVYLILMGPPNPPVTIRISGTEVRYLNPDERSTGSLVRNALLKVRDEGEIQSSPGIYASRKGLKDVLEGLKDTKIIYLHENGTCMEEAGLENEEDITFVLGDHMDLTEDEERILEEYGPVKISLGPQILHADHCIIVSHNILDRKGAEIK